MATTSKAVEISPDLFLAGKTARELMTPNVVSISMSATLEAAVYLLTDKKLSALPVTDDNGDAVGVLSRTDIVGHDFKQFQHLHESAPLEGELSMVTISDRGNRCPSGKKEVLVGDIMTKVLYSVTPTTAAKTVIDAMLSLGIHRLFVSDESGKLQGVISSTDVLRHLQEPMTITFEQVELLTVDRQDYAEACGPKDGC